MLSLLFLKLSPASEEESFNLRTIESEISSSQTLSLLNLRKGEQTLVLPHCLTLHLHVRSVSKPLFIFQLPISLEHFESVLK